MKKYTQGHLEKGKKITNELSVNRGWENELSLVVEVWRFR